MNSEQTTTLALKKKQHYNLLCDFYVREMISSMTTDAKENAIKFEELNRKWKLQAVKANRIGNYKVNINAFELSFLDAYKQLKNQKQ